MGKGAARGLALRLDNGPQHLAEDFRDELKFLAIESAPKSVEEPEGNGIVERVIGLLKEQSLWGRRLVDLAEAREQTGAFIARYNAQWLIERPGFRSPVEAWVAQGAEVRGGGMLTRRQGNRVQDIAPFSGLLGFAGLRRRPFVVLFRVWPTVGAEAGEAGLGKWHKKRNRLAGHRGGPCEAVPSP